VKNLDQRLEIEGGDTANTVVIGYKTRAGCALLLALADSDSLLRHFLAERLASVDSHTVLAIGQSPGSKQSMCREDEGAGSHPCGRQEWLLAARLPLAVDFSILE